MKTYDNAVMSGSSSSFKTTSIILVALLVWLYTDGHSRAAELGKPSCTPTAPDALGPFYKPKAPYRHSVGKGYILEGKVMTASGCVPIAGAVIELWLAGPEGDYLDTYRARMRTNADGSYRFECSYPPPYGGRPPHVHIRVAAPEHQTLVTQHYPSAGSSRGFFDLVLVPAR